MIRLVRLFTGPDGQSHVEDGEVPLATQDAVNAVARQCRAPRRSISRRRPPEPVSTGTTTRIGAT